MLWFTWGKDCGSGRTALGTAGHVVHTFVPAAPGASSTRFRTHRAVGTSPGMPSRDDAMSSTIHSPYYLYKSHIPFPSR
jgi:hypothetical protein